MGGPGSGRHNGQHGRNAGTGNSAEHTEAMRAGMLAAHAIKASRPDVCEACGSKPATDWFQRRWLCGSCLLDKMEPLRIEDFIRTGTSNLGDACECHGMLSDHARGPEGDRANRRIA